MGPPIVALEVEQDRPFTTLNGSLRVSGSGRLMSVTSAPSSARKTPANGPGPIPTISTTLTPRYGSSLTLAMLKALATGADQSNQSLPR